VSIAETFRSSVTLRAAYAAGKRHFGYAALFSALLNLLFIAPMLYMLQVYDRVVPTQGKMTLLFLTLILIISLATLAAMEAIRSRLLVRASVKLDQQLAGPIMRATLLQPDSGQRLARQAVREFDTLRNALTGPAMHGLLDAPWVPIYLLIAFLIHPWIGVLTLSGALIIIFLAWRTEVANRERLQEANAAAGRSYATYDASVSGSDVVRALGLRDALVTGHLADRQAMTGLQTDAGLTTARLASYSKFTRLLLQSLALGVGALLAISAKVSPGCDLRIDVHRRARACTDRPIGGRLADGDPGARVDQRARRTVRHDPAGHCPHLASAADRPAGSRGADRDGAGAETDPLQCALCSSAGRSGCDRRAKRRRQVDAGAGDRRCGSSPMPGISASTVPSSATGTPSNCPASSASCHRKRRCSRDRSRIIFRASRCVAASRRPLSMPMRLPRRSWQERMR
jgi:hypothetical protein